MRKLILSVISSLLFFSSIAIAQEKKPLGSYLITNVWVIDGTGTPARKASVRIKGNMIDAVGDLKAINGEAVINGNKKFLVPGFIDSHSHVEGSLQKYPEALAALNQGITTIVAGQDGDSEWMDSLKTKLLTHPKAINVASFTGHTTIREKIMGAENINRPANSTELEKMKILLKEELQKGALGLSTGLEYEGAFYSSKEEVIEMAKVAAEAKTRYQSHIRSEDIFMKDAVAEIINIGKETKLPVILSHIKIALKDDWGKADSLIAQLQKARAEGVDITADCYPYTFWNSTIRVLFPKKGFDKTEEAEYATDHLFDPAGSVLVRFAPDTTYKGKTVAEIAALRNETPAQALLYLVAAAEKYKQQHPEAGSVEAIMGKSMLESDVAGFIAWPNTNICSDGANGGHPRGYGSFTRVLHKYVVEDKLLPVETAIYKMTGLTAEHAGIKKRGLIVPGYFADLVLLDMKTVKDNSSIQNPKALSDGILKVWVNGILAYENKQSTGKFAGIFVSR